MNIEFEYTHHGSEYVSRSVFKSVAEVKACFGVLIDDALWDPAPESIGFRLIDDNGVLVCEVSLVRVSTQDKIFDTAISVEVGSETIRVARFCQPIAQFWYFLGHCASAFSPPYDEQYNLLDSLP